jgi:thiol-disulfide isomerase/thioredoxin
VLLRAILASVIGVVAAASALAERTEVYSIRGADCASCAERLESELRKLPGIRKVRFDKHKVELSVRMEDGIQDAVVLAAAERAGVVALAGAGRGSYLPHPDYPAGADVVTLTKDGSKVGPLEKLRAPGKYTVFDVYADWCGPCRDVERRLFEIVAVRRDVAVRRLNVVDFDSPLAKEIGAKLDTLPYVVVFTPTGKRSELAGASLKKLEAALAPR